MELRKRLSDIILFDSNVIAMHSRVQGLLTTRSTGYVQSFGMIAIVQ